MRHLPGYLVLINEFVGRNSLGNIKLDGMFVLPGRQIIGQGSVQLEGDVHSAGQMIPALCPMDCVAPR